jgi:hypothetical protein
MLLDGLLQPGYGVYRLIASVCMLPMNAWQDWPEGCPTICIERISSIR